MIRNAFPSGSAASIIADANGFVYALRTICCTDCTRRIIGGEIAAYVCIRKTKSYEQNVQVFVEKAESICYNDDKYIILWIFVL